MVVRVDSLIYSVVGRSDKSSGLSCSTASSQDPSDHLMLRALKLYDLLSEEACPDHVILDDRTHLTMGTRLRDSQRMGYPCTVVIGHKVRHFHM